MKQKSIIYFLLIVSSVVFTSCFVHKDYVRNIIKNEAIQKPKTKRVLITAADINFNINSFEKTFDKNYGETFVFANEYASEVATGLINESVFSTVVIDEVNKWTLLEDGYNPNTIAEINSLTEKANADYLISISNFTIASRYERVYVASGGFNNPGGGHYNNKEYGVVKAKVTVYDLKSKKKIVTFDTEGESAIFFFDFTTTLKKAKARSITHLVNYLKNGTVQYKKN